VMRVLPMLEASRTSSRFADRIECAILHWLRNRITSRILQVVLNKLCKDEWTMYLYCAKVLLTFGNSADSFVKKPSSDLNPCHTWKSLGFRV
jgi:hypothetical protein